MAMVSLGFILINKLFCFISAGCLLAMRQHASFQPGMRLYWEARWGKVGVPSEDVIISRDNYHFWRLGMGIVRYRLLFLPR